MFSQATTLAALLVLTAGAAATPTLAPRKPTECYAGETPALHCYNAAGDTPQDVVVDDIQYVATYLRNYGRKNPRKPAFYTLRAVDSPDCHDETLYSRGSVLAQIKHINTTVDTSVLYEDIANTIDGGENADAAARAKSLIGCKTDGGRAGVFVNATNPAYKTEAYVNAGYTGAGALIKIVWSGS